MWAIVQEFCLHGCSEVVLVRCATTGLVLAYCRMCGAAWLDPEDIQHYDFAVASELFSQGIEIPNREEVARSNWAGSVQGSIPEADYSTATEINVFLARDRLQAALKPASRRPPGGEAEFRPPWPLGIVEGLAAWFLKISGGVGPKARPSLMERLKQAREQSRRND